MIEVLETIAYIMMLVVANALMVYALVWVLSGLRGLIKDLRR